MPLLIVKKYYLLLQTILSPKLKLINSQIIFTSKNSNTYVKIDINFLKVNGFDFFLIFQCFKKNC